MFAVAVDPVTSVEKAVVAGDDHLVVDEHRRLQLRRPARLGEVRRVPRRARHVGVDHVLNMARRIAEENLVVLVAVGWELVMPAAATRAMPAMMICDRRFLDKDSSSKDVRSPALQQRPYRAVYVPKCA
jgi:hypothetical protein